MRAASTRYGKRKVYVAGILLLAGVFLYHGMRSLEDASAAGEVAAVAHTDGSACDWEEGGPELFVIRHNELHPEGEYGWSGNACRRLQSQGCRAVWVAISLIAVAEMETLRLM